METRLGPRRAAAITQAEQLRGELARLDAAHAALNDRQLELQGLIAELTTSVERLVEAAAGAASAISGASAQERLLDAVKAMQETQMSFNLQYLQLQSQMQHENRSYTAVSNIMKTKHDTVKNSISNIR